MGIRGNKFLDGNSRGPNVENPAYNYVLFSDEDVEITAKYSRPKMPPKERKEAEKAAEGLSTGARRVKDTISVYGMEDGLNEATGANSKARDALTYVEDMSSPVRIGVLKGMPTSGILNWLRRKASPEIHKLARTVGDTVSKMGALRASLTQAAEPIERDMDDFTREYGSEALAELRFTARINGVDPLAFGTAEAALKGDAVLKPIEDALLKNSNNKAETRRLIDEIKAQVAKTSDTTQVFKDKVRLSTPVRAKLNALAKLAIDNSKVTLKVEQLAARTQEVRDTYIAKEALSKQKGGLALYKAERDYHKDMFDARVALLDESGKDSFNPEQAKQVRKVRAEIMREVQSPEERQKGGDLFWDIDPELFAKDYFPMVRDGDYWLRVSEDVKARREEALHVFKSARELAKAQRQLAKQLGVDPNDRTVLKTGNRLADLQNTIRSEDELMKRVFDIVDKAKSQFKASGNVDMQELVDAIYQTYLLTTPERSARRRFMHAKEIAGFSLNVFDNFRKQVATNANELTKLAYAGKVRADVDGLKTAINTPDRPGKEAVMLDDFARELEFRAEQEINPPPAGTLNAVINVLNRTSFLYFLTSAKTALTNFANIPIRVVPRFWRDYGYAEGTAMWLNYMQMWKSLGRVKIERTNMRFGDYLDAVMPNVNGSSFVKNNADLQWALRAGTERGILMTTVDTISQNERSNPLQQQTGVVRTAQDVTANVLKSMTFLFTGTENISRQATFYMAFELELKKQKREHPTKALEAQRQAALAKAVEIVDDTIGNFANWERPSLTKGELSRGFFLFKMHPILQTKFMVGAFRDIVAAPLRGVARQATGRGKLSKEDTAEVAGALKELSGVLMMSGLLGGISAMPLYTAMVEALAYAFEPDPDDDDDVNKLMREDVANAYDADIAFRRWLSGYLGVDESGESQLANILIDGPVGVLTDTEMSSTVSLDLMKLWYREPIAGDNLESTAIAALIANVAGLSTASQIMRGADELMQGNTREALKKISPAFFRSWVNAYYNANEGVKNRKDDTIIPKEKITASDTFRSALGARSLRLAKWQDYSITALKNEDRINKERQEIFDEIEQMRDNGEFATMEDFRAYWNEVVVPFNRTYPNERFIITEESVERSLRARDERGSRTVDGRLINKKDAERILRSQELFRPK
jgi:predicted DNA-binding protein